MVTFQVGERVRVIPASYVDLAKGFFNSPVHWANARASDDEIMLGATYEILGSRMEGTRVWYCLLSSDRNNSGMILRSFLRFAREVPNCEFVEGDEVRFAPKCNSSDIYFLKTAMSTCYEFSDPTRSYVVRSVLNGYYIFLNYGIDDGCAFPFRWEDFRRLDAGV